MLIQVFYLKSCKTIENEGNNQENGFFGMLLSSLDASLLGNILAGKDVIRDGDGFAQAFKGTIKVFNSFSSFN